MASRRHPTPCISSKDVSSPTLPASVTVRDVTLREYGQNVPASALELFGIERRLSIARGLMRAGISTFEVASTASPRVAPAMATELIRPFLKQLGSPSGIELLTLVPNRRGFERFLSLGLGSDGYGHTLGVFVSAMDDHNVANLGKTVEETLSELSSFVPEARAAGIPVVGYVSAAFGFARPDGVILQVSAARVARLIAHLASLGVATVTLSDLQGLASPVVTASRFRELIGESLTSSVPLGYHPHHHSAEAVLDNVQAAYESGVRIFDASLRAVGGCVTGAPGNAPTEGVVQRLEALGATTGVDERRLQLLAKDVDEKVFKEAIRLFEGHQ